MILKGNKDEERWGEREKEEKERRKQTKKVITEHLLPARHRASCFHMLRNPINLAAGVGNSKGSAMCSQNWPGWPVLKALHKYYLYQGNSRAIVFQAIALISFLQDK